jgi:hypothetical protein
VPPVAAVGVLDYLFAADLLMNVEYRFERLLKFSTKSIESLRDQWGVPEPFNYVVFLVLSLFSIIISQKILSTFFGGNRKSHQQSNFRFNTPDSAEIGVLVNDIKKLHEELSEIKKSLGNHQGGNNNHEQDTTST